MKRKWKSRGWAALITAVLLLAAAGCGAGRTVRASIAYAADPRRADVGQAVVYEQRDLSAPAGDTLYLAVLEAALLPPQSQGLLSPYPDGLSVLSVTALDGIVTVDMSEEYAALRGAALTLADYCTVLTLSALDDVEGVVITAAGSPVGGRREGEVLRRRDVVLHAAALRAAEREVTLYFPDDLRGLLRAEGRKVLLTDDDAAPQAVVRALLEGKSDGEGGYISFLDEDAAVYSVQVQDAVCVLDVNAAFFSRPHLNAQKKSLTVYAFVHTLTALPGIEKVRFLSEGQAVPAYVLAGLSEPVQPVESLVYEG